MNDNVMQVTDASYQQDVIESDLPVLVDFWAPWCGPCRIVGPVIEQLAEEYEERLRVAKVNTDENQATPGSLGIRGIPTLVFYLNGEEQERVVGVRPKEELKSMIENLLEKSEA